MAEAAITFKREEREGVIPVDSYLLDAARRFGIRFEEKCDVVADIHFCRVTVEEGEKHLSPLTSAETQHLKEAESGERLACQARIIEPGEIVVMTKETKKETKEPEVETGEKYAKEFADLPLEKKIAELVHLEALTLSETFSFILNSPYLVIDKVMDVMAEFGLKKEEEGKKAARPKEHVNGSESKDAVAPEEAAAEGKAAPSSPSE